LFGRGGGRPLEVLERQLDVDHKATAAWEVQHHVGVGAVGRGHLDRKVPVLGHAGGLQQVLQHELAGPAAVPRVGEDSIDLPGPANPAEKRKIGGSTEPLTTGSLILWSGSYAPSSVGILGLVHQHRQRGRPDSLPAPGHGDRMVLACMGSTAGQER
jgi:hypothetical protein